MPEAKARLERFLAEGAHGDMVWMETTAERRGAPSALWPDVRSVIMLGMNYGPDHDPLAILQERTRGAISVYAQGEDYHELIKARLKQLARWLVANAGGDVKVFVDTAAVMEKPLGGRRRSRLAGQAHQFGVAPIWLVAVSRFDLHDARSAGRSAQPKTVAAAAAPASTSARPRRFPSRTGSMRGAAFRI